MSTPTTSRPRGRPPGSKAQVIRDARALGIHHFAFVRASLWGLDLSHAFERYLAWSETTTDLRYVQNRRDDLLKQIIDAGRHLNASLPEHAKITDILDLLRSDMTVASAIVLPTLEEWVESEGMDPDVWSEADLIAEYQSAFGLDNADALAAAEGAKDVVAERVRALNHLATLLAVTPGAQDRLEMWLAKPVALSLRNVGLLTLADLVNVKRTKVDTFVLVKLFLQLPRAEATEENPFKSMAYHLIEVKMFSSVGNKPNLANMTSRLYSRSCVAPLKKVLGISKLPKSWGKRQGMQDNNFTSTSTTIATLLQLELK